MKRWLAMLLALVMGLSLFGCSSGNGGDSFEDRLKKETEEEEEEDDGSDFLTGKWGYLHTSSYFGGTKIFEVQYAELKSNGTVKNESNTSSWKYSVEDNTIKIAGETFSLAEVDGQVVAQTTYNDWGTYFRIVENCPVCSGICVGTWEQLTDYPERTTAEFRDDGTMTVNGEEHTWKSICGPDLHLIEVSDYGVVRIDPHGAVMSLMDYTFYRNNELTFIEITPDNWTEYFSADFMYNFDMHYHTEKTTVGDEWEQKVVQNLSSWPTLKWGDNLATTEELNLMGSWAQLMVEYSFEEGMQTFTLDDQGNVIPGEITQEHHDRYTDTMYVEPIRWYNEGNDTVQFAGDISGWNTNDISQPITVKIPNRIQRMKGWIAVKDMNAIPEPIQPPPEEGINEGDLCYGAHLQIATGEGITEETFDPTKTGKVTVINFWGTWCGPCMEELATLHAIAEQYADSVTVAAVHSLAAVETMPGFILEHFPASNIVFLADYGAYSDGEYYNTITGGSYPGFPYTVILNKEGVITKVFSGAAQAEELQAAVEEALK